MKILLFGVSNVGKTTTGELLAERLGFKFYDLDEEVKSCLGITLEEFVHTADLRWRDQQRGNIIKDILRSKDNIVLAICPISFTDNFKRQLNSNDVLSIELYDTPENIFSRLVFSDENDNLYIDVAYKEERKDHYLKDIRSDLYWYGNIFTEMGVQNRVFVNNDPQEKVVDRIIAEYGLDKYIDV